MAIGALKYYILSNLLDTGPLMQSIKATMALVFIHWAL